MGAGGQWVAGEGVVDGAHGFCVVKISSGFRCAHFSIGDVVVSGRLRESWPFRHIEKKG
jgi:hypothetical protein